MEGHSVWAKISDATRRGLKTRDWTLQNMIPWQCRRIIHAFRGIEKLTLGVMFGVDPKLLEAESLIGKRLWSWTSITIKPDTLAHDFGSCPSDLKEFLFEAGDVICNSTPSPLDFKFHLRRIHIRSPGDLPHEFFTSLLQPSITSTSFQFSDSANAPLMDVSISAHARNLKTLKIDSSLATLITATSRFVSNFISHCDNLVEFEVNSDDLYLLHSIPGHLETLKITNLQTWRDVVELFGEKGPGCLKSLKHLAEDDSSWFVAPNPDWRLEGGRDELLEICKSRGINVELSG